MASINQSLGILRASGLASDKSYAVKNALEIIKQLYGLELSVDLFLKDLRFPAICQQEGVIGGLLPVAVEDRIEYAFTPLIKAAYKLVAVSLETPREGAKYVSLNFVGALPHVDEDMDEGEESTVRLPNLLVSGKVYSVVNSAWEYESETAADVFLSPEKLPTTNGEYTITRISPNSNGGGYVELSDRYSFRTNEKNLALMEVGFAVTVEDNICKIGQQIVSIGELTALLNFNYKIDQTFFASAIQKLGKFSYKFTSGENEYWVPGSLKRLLVAMAPDIPAECLCEVIGETEKDGKKYPKVGIVYSRDPKYNVKKEKAEILVPIKEG